MKSKFTWIIVITIFIILLIGIICLVLNQKDSKPIIPYVEKPNDKTLDDEISYDKIPDDYIAALCFGSGDYARATYIYKINNGTDNMKFRYINEESYGMTAESWTSKILNIGEVNSLEDILVVAKENEALGFAILPNDTKAYTIEEFKEMFIINIEK